MTKHSNICKIMLGILLLTGLSLPAEANPGQELARRDSYHGEGYSFSDGTMTFLSVVGAIIDNVIANEANGYYYDRYGNVYAYEAGYDYYCARCHKRFYNNCCKHWPRGSHPYRLVRVGARDYGPHPHFAPPPRPHNGHFTTHRRPDFVFRTPPHHQEHRHEENRYHNNNGHQNHDSYRQPAPPSYRPSSHHNSNEGHRSSYHPDRKQNAASRSVSSTSNSTSNGRASRAISTGNAQSRGKAQVQGSRR